MLALPPSPNSHFLLLFLLLSFSSAPFSPSFASLKPHLLQWSLQLRLCLSFQGIFRGPLWFSSLVFFVCFPSFLAFHLCFSFPSSTSFIACSSSSLSLSTLLLLSLSSFLPPSHFTSPPLSYFMAVSVGFLLYLCFFSAESFISPPPPPPPHALPPSLRRSLPPSSTALLPILLAEFM